MAPRSDNPQSSGFTLIELLITIAIIATLSALFLGASRSAMESARAARTKITIAKLHTLLMEQYASYETRRVDMNSTLEELTGDALLDMRLIAKRELMKFELPDRWSDIIGDNVRKNPPNTNISSFPFPRVLESRPALANIYLRAYTRLKTQDVEVIENNQGAECLYLIITYACGDGESRSLFQDRDIGDTDGDGAQEFLDGWGHPITFIRWPAGFADISEVMTGPSDLSEQEKNSPSSGLPITPGDKDHDPFDPFQRDKNGIRAPKLSVFPARAAHYLDEMRNDGVTAFRLVPLIYSPGPDGLLGLHTNRGYVSPLDPYLQTPEGLYIGEPISADNTEYQDNIHNQLIETR